MKGAGDVLLTGSRPVGTATGTIPSSPVPGTDPLFACADDLKGVKETSETNDCRMATGSVTVSQ